LVVQNGRMINALPPEVLVQVLDALLVRVFWKDLDSRYLGCNQRFAEDVAMSDSKDFIGKSDYYFYPPDQATAFRADDALVMHTKAPIIGIVEKVTRADGRSVWLEINKFPMRDAAGRIIGVIGTYQDITDRKLAADELSAAA
jgi:PAS domain S-box-containing protein